MSYRCGRDGDVVSIRVSEDGNTLDIHDNHAPDASISSATPVTAFAEESEGDK